MGAHYRKHPTPKFEADSLSYPGGSFQRVSGLILRSILWEEVEQRQIMRW